jgi:hypothetical protein
LLYCTFGSNDSLLLKYVYLNFVSAFVQYFLSTVLLRGSFR